MDCRVIILFGYRESMMDDFEENELLFNQDEQMRVSLL